MSECSTNWPTFCNFVEDRISVGVRADPRLILIYIISQLEYESFWLIEELSKPPGTALENSTVDHWVCGDLLPVSLCGICLVWYSKDSDQNLVHSGAVKVAGSIKPSFAGFILCLALLSRSLDWWVPHTESMFSVLIQAQVPGWSLATLEFMCLQAGQMQRWELGAAWGAPSPLLKTIPMTKGTTDVMPGRPGPSRYFRASESFRISFFKKCICSVALLISRGVHFPV